VLSETPFKKGFSRTGVLSERNILKKEKRKTGEIILKNNIHLLSEFQLKDKLKK
jgi:hypothetical protein